LKPIFEVISSLNKIAFPILFNSFLASSCLVIVRFSIRKVVLRLAYSNLGLWSLRNERIAYSSLGVPIETILPLADGSNENLPVSVSSSISVSKSFANLRIK